MLVYMICPVSLYVSILLACPNVDYHINMIKQVTLYKFCELPCGHDTVPE